MRMHLAEVRIMGLPNPDSLSLLEAVSFVVSRCNCSDDAAKGALRRAGLEGRLRADGSIPLSAHPDPKKRGAHPYKKRQELRPEDWEGQIDWGAGKIGPYSSVLIKTASIEAWLVNVPAATTIEAETFRSAPDAKIRDAIRTAYNEAEAAGRKAPNVNEIIKPVQEQLRAEGYDASGRRIQDLADNEEFAKRRRKRGVTVASEKRPRQK
jgi:hypothetical protein